MADDSKPISEEEAIQRAKEELGEEGTAKLLALPLGVRKALLKALRPPQELSTLPGASRNRGGRPKGAGKMDLIPAFRRMAELQELDPTLKDRPAAILISEEMKTAELQVSPETLRKEYRKIKERFIAEARERKRPRPHRIVKAVVVESGRAAGPLDYLGFSGNPAATVEEMKRAILGPSVADLVAQVKVPDYAAEFARSIVGPGAAWEAVEADIRRIKESASIEALRGLELMLGKKPIG